MLLRPSNCSWTLHAIRQENLDQMSPFQKHMPCCVDPTVEAVCQSDLQKHIVGVQPIMNVKIILSFLWVIQRLRPENRHYNLSAEPLPCPFKLREVFSEDCLPVLKDQGAMNSVKSTKLDKIITCDILHKGKWKFSLGTGTGREIYAKLLHNYYSVRLDNCYGTSEPPSKNDINIKWIVFVSLGPSVQSNFQPKLETQNLKKKKKKLQKVQEGKEEMDKPDTNIWGKY